MSNIRTRFVSAVVVLSGFYATCASAQEPGHIQQIRDWATEFFSGDAADMSVETASADGAENPNSVADQFVSKGQAFVAQVGALIEQRIGWLRPTNVKEQALIWMAIAMALPWGFVSWLRPILKNDILIIRLAVVGSWTGIALWSAWYTWGIASGADRFASTMLFGVPVLLIYFNSVASSVAVPAEAGSCPE